MQHLVTTDIDLVSLYRFSPALFPTEMDPNNKHKVLAGLVVDTETTGVQASDKVIEVAALPFLFDLTTNKLLCVFQGYNGLQDPGMPIPAEATAVNGITDDMVRGRKIDWARLREMLHNADFVIAHNAAFDRPMIHRGLVEAGVRIPAPTWGCSLQQISWKDTPAAPPANNLAVLCAWHGFFFSAHRALGDCQALLHLLAVSGTLPAFWETASKSDYLVRALGNTFQFKDKVKARGYRFFDQAGTKGWQIACSTLEEAEAERQWLRDNVYGRGGDSGETVAMSPKERFL